MCVCQGWEEGVGFGGWCGFGGGSVGGRLYLAPLPLSEPMPEKRRLSRRAARTHLQRLQLGDGLGELAPLHVVRRAGQHLLRC